MTDQTCYFCESTDEIEEHHILPQRFDGSDLPTNTVDLCHDCHWKLERLYNKDFWEAIGVDDPRATKESHINCSINGCMEKSIGLFGVKRGAVVPRCSDHKPSYEYEESSDGKNTDDINVQNLVDEYKPPWRE